LKIAHIADTHIKNLKYHEDYRICFEQMYEILREQEVDYIVHCGDIAHTKTQISPEFVEMASELFSNLAEIAPLFVILGNHDGNLKNSNRQDAITPIVQALDNPNISLLKNAGEAEVNDKLTLNVLSVFDRDNWVQPTNLDKINIALYHGAISNCQTDAGWTMEYGEDNISIFQNFDFAMLGDIHKRQILDEQGRVYYAGSTVQQNHGESNDKGFSIWTINSKDDWDIEHFTLQNPRPFITVELTRTGKIPRRTKVPTNARLRIVSDNNLSLDVMRKAVGVARHKFQPESISFLNRAAGKRGNVEDIADGLGAQNLRDPEVQQELISEYLKDYQVKSDVLTSIYELNSKYNQQVEAKEDIGRNVNWELVSFEWSNLFNYGEKNSIDFRKINGITGIFGKNFSGKSSIIDAVLFTIFNTTSKNERKNVNVVNQNKNWGEGKVVIKISNKTYTIHRKVEKYEKKSQGTVSIEAKTLLEFSVYDPVTDKTKSLNGTTRNQTDANIRKRFGTIDDFLISSMASQHGALDFINEGSTKRKEIIAKFLDLQFFDKKFKFAKEDAQSSKVLIKKLDGRDYDKEIEEAKVALEKHKAAIVTVEQTKTRLDKQLKSASQKVSELSGKISSTPAEVIDIHSLRSEIRKTKNQIISLSDSIFADGERINKENERLGGISSLLKTLDYDKLTNSLADIDEAEEQLQTHTQTLEVAIEKKKLLEDIPCGTSYPACKFIRDAHVATAVIPEVESKIGELQKSLSGLNPEIVREHLDKFYKLEKKQVEIESLIKDLQLDVERKRASLDRHNTLISELSQKQEIYNNNKEAIENLEKLLKEKQLYVNKSKSIEEQIKSNSEEKINFYKSLGSEEQRIENLEQDKVEFESIRSEYSSYDLFLRCMHPNGIGYDIIKQKLPIINEEIAKILANVVDFEIFFETTGNKFDIFIKHPKHEARPIEMASGAEKSMAAMAIRLALLSVSSLPKGDVFVLDEPGTALDEENMAGFIRILELIKVYFKNVLLISHLESLKDSVDMQIVIEKENSFAKVKQ
jgi:DNA repair exonuclease SbcCD nuclease subunit/ABC-type cobalamin/Fe3+-siderophores transport system ATPase subunit